MEQHLHPKDELYSQLPNARLSAALEVGDFSVITNEIASIKPYFWFGSGNAWLVFLGSSPGGSPPKGKEDKSNYKSEILFSKASNHFEQTKDGTGFWNKIVDYTKTLFPEIENNNDLFRLILAGNLVDNMEGKSKNLDKEDLKFGAVDSFKVMSIVRPKVIICLQKSVYNLVYSMAKLSGQEIQNSEILKIKSGTKKDVKYEVPINFFKSTDARWNKWILTRVPIHPSRSNFCTNDNFKEQFLQPLMAKAGLYFKD